jgi:quercetin dioxygenase-like cupin family protein
MDGTLPTTFAWSPGKAGCVGEISSSTTGSVIEMQLCQLDGGATERDAFEKGVDYAVVVLDGTVDIQPLGAPKQAVKGVGPWHGVRAQGAGVSIHVTSATPARIARVFVGPDHPGKKLPLSKTFKREGKGAALVPFDFSALPDLAWGQGAYHARIGWEDPAALAVLDAVSFSHDAKVAEHVHEKEWECLAVLTGEGEVIIAGTPKSMSPGSIACIPPNTKHAWLPRGKDPLYALQVYTPPGPEQRFKKLAGPK